jgi:hypothetical protein
MLERCRNPKSYAHAYYAGRGISVCDRWAKFANFLADMGERPDGTTLDRVDNDGNYEPGNCRWATKREQQGNTRLARRMLLSGEPVCLAEAARRLGVATATLQNDLNRRHKRPAIYPTLQEAPK